MKSSKWWVWGRKRRWERDAPLLCFWRNGVAPADEAPIRFVYLFHRDLMAALPVCSIRNSQTYVYNCEPILEENNVCEGQVSECTKRSRSRETRLNSIKWSRRGMSIQWAKLSQSCHVCIYTKAKDFPCCSKFSSKSPSYDQYQLYRRS